MNDRPEGILEPLPLDQAIERATKMVAWSRSCPYGWIHPRDVYEALEQPAPQNPTWNGAIGALAHAYLEMQLGSREGGRLAAN